MFWLFATCLVALVGLFTFKLHEHKAGGFVILSGSRRSADRQLAKTGAYLWRQMRRIIERMLSVGRNLVVRIRHTIAEWLRSLASHIDLR